LNFTEVERVSALSSIAHGSIEIIEPKHDYLKAMNCPHHHRIFAAVLRAED